MNCNETIRYQLHTSFFWKRSQLPKIFFGFQFSAESQDTRENLPWYVKIHERIYDDRWKYTREFSHVFGYHKKWKYTWEFTTRGENAQKKFRCIIKSFNICLALKLKNTKLFNILNREKSWNDWKLCHNSQTARKLCRIAAMCRENLQNFQCFGL